MKPKHIRMYTSVNCEDSIAARHFLREQGVHFEEVDIDECPKALAFVISFNEGKRRTPTFDVDGHIFHCSPFDRQKIIRELGFPPSRPARGDQSEGE